MGQERGMNQDVARLRSPTGIGGRAKIICSLKDLQTPRGGDIFVEKCTVFRITPERGEIFFNISFLLGINRQKIVPSSYDSGMTAILKKNKK